MRAWAIVVALLVGAGAARAEELLMEFSWSRLKEEGRLDSGEVLPPDAETDFECLKVVNPESELMAAQVLEVEAPGVTASSYAISGQVRCEGLEDRGFLEMWSFFPDGGHYFSRTLGESGPMGQLEGTSGWRLFTLPFSIEGADRRPEKLQVNVVLPGRGTVFLGPLRLTQPGEGPLEALEAPPAAGQWWDDRTGGLIGGLAGGAFGCLGALLGVVMGLGVARRLVRGLLVAAVACGVISLIAGVVALACSQPYAVYYPLLLLGVLVTVIPGGMLPVARKRYEALELRRMQAMDAR